MSHATRQQSRLPSIPGRDVVAVCTMVYSSHWTAVCSAASGSPAPSPLNRCSAFPAKQHEPRTTHGVLYTMCYYIGVHGPLHCSALSVTSNYSCSSLSHVAHAAIARQTTDTVTACKTCPGRSNALQCCLSFHFL